MRTIAHFFALTAALCCAPPLQAEQFAVSDLKAFDAKLTAAFERCDVATIVDRISPIATITGTAFARGDMRAYRMNRSQYGEVLTRACAAGRTWHSAASNEKISIERDQAFMTADVVETTVLNGRQTTTKSRQRLTVELIDGKLMLTQVHVNLVD